MQLAHCQRSHEIIQDAMASCCSSPINGLMELFKICRSVDCACVRYCMQTALSVRVWILS